MAGDVVLTKYESDISQMLSALDQAQKELIETGQVGEKSFDGINKSINDVRSTLDGFGKKIEDALNKLEKGKPKIKSATSDFNGLQNSINQISRELPAFTLSLQTGFLAVSNNLPILFDELNRIKAANKALVAEGKQTQSVLSQIGASLLSWNTALSLGIALLTQFGGKLFETSSATKEVTLSTKLAREEQEKYNKAYEDQIRRQRKEGRESATEIDERAKKNLESQYLINDARGVGLKGLERELKLLKSNKDSEENRQAVFEKEEEIIDERIRRLKLLKQESATADAQLKADAEIGDLLVEKEVKRREFAKKNRKDEEDELLHSLQRRKKIIEADDKMSYDMQKQAYDLQISIFKRQIQLAEDNAIKQKDIEADLQAFILSEKRKGDDEYAKLADKKQKDDEKAREELLRIRRAANEAEAQYEQDKIDKFNESYQRDREALLENERTSFDQRRALIDEQQEQGLLTEQEAANARMEINKAETEARLSQLSAIADGINSIAQIAGEDTEEGKALAASATLIETFVAAQRAYSGGFAIDPTGTLSIINASAATLAGLARVQKILSVEVPKPKQKGFNKISYEQSYKDGVVDLAGPGTTTSDSIPAWLSRGESVIKASSTAGYKDELRALNHSPLDYEKLLRTKYVEPALEAERRQVVDLADNIARSLAIHNAFSDKNIVKELKANRQSNQRDIAQLTDTIARNGRANDFERKLYKPN